MLEINNVYHGNSLELLKQLDDNSIDSIVTDPPYELGFMGKSWDSTGIAYNVELWKECLRVLKHGGHLLSFGGTRTYHRMACAIEDAGFEIRDQIQWIYGSGFPKSHNISKAIDKKLGAEREIVGERKVTPSDLGQSSGWNHLDTSKGVYNYTIPATELAKQWDGWGTALKPANEPIVMGRKPLSEKSVVDNVIKYGTGGININDCRITYSENDDMRIGKNYVHNAKAGLEIGNHKDNINGEPQQLHNSEGRFPANIIFNEESARLLDKQSGTSISKKGKPRIAETKNQTKLNNSKEVQVNCEYNDSGGASRFFYCAKAAKKEKGDFNTHPTVKPIKLMEYLVRLVTPSNGIILDPFAGSGTTLLAAKNEDKNYIGFELNEEYIEIIKNRLE
jgi:DNA modification methylase